MMGPDSRDRGTRKSSCLADISVEAIPLGGLAAELGRLKIAGRGELGDGWMGWHGEVVHPEFWAFCA